MKKARFYAGLIHLLDFLGWYRIIKWWRRRQPNNPRIMAQLADFYIKVFLRYPQIYPQFYFLHPPMEEGEQRKPLRRGSEWDWKVRIAE